MRDITQTSRDVGLGCFVGSGSRTQLMMIDRTSGRTNRTESVSRALVRIIAVITWLAAFAGAAASAQIIQHTITTTAGAGGSIFPAGPVIVPAGAKPTFLIIANAGLSIQDVKVNNLSVGMAPQVQFEPVHEAVAISATFVKSPTISASSTGPGTITPSGSSTVGMGGNRTYKMEAAVGAMLSSLTVNNVAVTLPDPKPGQLTHTVTGITGTTTVKATFATDPAKAVLTATAGAGGSISPMGKLEVMKEADQTFHITPNSGFYTAAVKVDGKSLTGPQDAFKTLSNVLKAQTIAATFAKNPVVSAKQAAGGVIEPMGDSGVSYNGSKSYTITPATGYEIANLVVDGKPVTDTSGFYTVTNILKNTSITAVFRALSTTHVVVTSSAGTGGMISPLGKVGVLKNSSRSFSISANAGYRILDVKLDGTSVGAASFPTVSVMEKARSIAASFTKNPVISAKQSVGGMISPAGERVVSYEGDQSYIITPETGFQISHLIIDGKVVQDTDEAFDFHGVKTNHSIAAVFKQRADYVTLTTTAGAGGTVNPLGKRLVPKGSDQEVNIIPTSSFRVLDVKVGKGSIGAVTTTTVGNILVDTTVAATFTRHPIITAKQVTGGDILPRGAKVVRLGEEQAYTINPTLGYKIDSLIIDGKPVADTSGSHTFTNVTKNATISAKFSLTNHVVTSTAHPGGAIMPLGDTNVLNGKDLSFTITPPEGFKAGVKINGIFKAQKPSGGALTYLLKNVRRNYVVEAVFAPIGTQFAGTLGIAPVGLGDTLKVANKSPAVFSLLTHGTLGVAGVYFHNATASSGGQASPGVDEDGWTASVPMVPGDNEIWFAAAGMGGEVAWYPTVVTYYPASDFTTPLSPYLGAAPLSTLTVGNTTTVTWKLGLLTPAGATVTLHRVENDDSLTQLVTMRDDGVLPDEISGDGIFTANASITAASSGYLYYRAYVTKSAALTYYSETKEVWVPEPLTDEEVNAAGEIADAAAASYETRTTAGDTPQEAAQFVTVQLKLDPQIGTVGTTEEGSVWWVTVDGVLGFHHPLDPGSRAGGGVPPGMADRAAPPLQDQVFEPAQNPFYRPADLATLFAPEQTEVIVGPHGATSFAAPPPALASDGKNRMRSDRAILISPYVANPDDMASSFGAGDDFYKPWPTIQAHKTCGLYADTAFVNNNTRGVTLASFKNLSSYGYIHICTHGDHLYNALLPNWQDAWGPNDFLKGNLSLVAIYTGLHLPMEDGKYLKGPYEDDINSKRIAIGSGGAIAVLPSFFSHYVGTLPNSLVMLASCRGGYNGSLMNVFRAKGAGAIIGYTDYVNSGYAQDTLQEIIDRMYGDKTLLEAMQSAVGKHGADDADSHPAALVLQGAADLRFPQSALTNAGFEDGVIGPWSRTGDARVITSLGMERPKEGKFMGIISTGLGFTTDAGSIDQRLCVPDTGGTLSFRWNMYSEEWMESVGEIYQDAFEVSAAVVNPATGTAGPFTPLFVRTIDNLASQVIPADVNLDTSPMGANDSAKVYRTTWRIDTLNLNSYVGKTLVLRFNCTDVGGSEYDSAVLLDDIKFTEGTTPP